jgi:ABC-type glycerol-3-phosphate transport system substrate-binding protein
MLVSGRQEVVTREDRDEQGRLIIRCWYLRANPDSTQEPGLLPLRAWKRRAREELVNYEMIEIFERENPDINIVLEKTLKGHLDPRAFAVLAATGQGPDICFNFQSSSVPTFARHGFLRKLDKYVNNWPRKDDFYERSWLPNMYAGHYYAIPDPWQNCMVGLIYRKDLFIAAGLVDEKGNPRPPRSWQELAEYAQRLTDRKNQIYGFGMDGGVSGGWNLQDYFWQAGTEIVEKQNGKWQAVFNNERGVKALRFIHDLKWKYNAIQPNILADTWSELRREFRNRRIAMYKGYYSVDYRALVGTQYLTPDDVGFAPLPAGPAGSVSQLAGGGWVISSQISEEKADAAWRFLTFLASERMMIYRVKRRYELGLSILENSSAFKNFKESDYVPEVERIPGVEEIIANGKVEPFCDNYDYIKESMSDIIQEVLLRKDITDEEIRKLLDKYVEYYNRYYLGEEKVRGE